MKLYKVLKRVDGDLISPFQKYKYSVGEKMFCGDFNSDGEIQCSKGYYATDVDGLIYTFRNLPGYEVWRCEVGGKSVEIDQFKRRYEWIKLLEYVPNEQVKELALAEENKVGYRLAEALFPVNPLKIKYGEVAGKDIELLKQWILVHASVGILVREALGESVLAPVLTPVKVSVSASVLASVWASVWELVEDLVEDLVGVSMGGLIGNSIRRLVRSLGWDPAEDVISSYISSLFPNIKKWSYIEHTGGTNPFQPAIDLWHRGLVPSHDGKVWRLHAGETATIVYEVGWELNE